METKLITIVESPRLRMIPMDIQFCNNKYVNWLNDPISSKYIESDRAYTLEKLKAYIVKAVNEKQYFWAIVKKGDNKHIGNIKIDPITKSTNSGEYGILLGDREEWGKGYAEEASKSIIDFCFLQLKLDALTLGVLENNVAAYKLYEKIGFKKTKIVRHKSVLSEDQCNVIRMIKNNE